MDHDRDDQHDDSENASPSLQSGILDRKIERRALPASFSSNLGRKAPSPRRDISDRSVRAMICLFEKSLSTPCNKSSGRPRDGSGAAARIDTSDGRTGEKSGHDDHGNGRKMANWPKQPPPKKCQPWSSRTMLPPVSPAPPPVQLTCQVEDYSLTLLKHKSYFNNRRLARCLDEFQESEENRNTRKEGTAKENAGDKSSQREGNTLLRKQSQNPSPIQQLDDLMDELLAWQGFSMPRTPEILIRREERDREDVERFWTRVRTHLWIDDEELDAKVQDPLKERRADIMFEDEATVAYDDSEKISKRFLPPAPNRSPPPVPTSTQAGYPRGDSCCRKQHSRTPSLEAFPDPDCDYPAWDQPPPTPSTRMSIYALGSPRLRSLSSGTSELEQFSWQFCPAEGEPGFPAKEANITHSRHPSSASSPWVRPPTWRSPRLDRTPATPALPYPYVGTSAAPSGQRHIRRTFQHQAHYHHPSKTSTSTISATSAITDSSGKSTQGSGTPKTPTSFVATRSTHTGSNTDFPVLLTGRRERRLTTEEKLSEIDAFLEPHGTVMSRGKGLI